MRRARPHGRLAAKAPPPRRRPRAHPRAEPAAAFVPLTRRLRGPIAIALGSNEFKMCRRQQKAFEDKCQSL